MAAGIINILCLKVETSAKHEVFCAPEMNNLSMSYASAGAYRAASLPLWFAGIVLLKNIKI